MSVADRCPDCDATLATQADYDAHPDGCECERCRSLCWRVYESAWCSRPPVDWRERALSAEAAVRRLRACPTDHYGSGGDVP